MTAAYMGYYIHTAYGVPPPTALPTLRIHQILYIITSPTDTDYVRTEIPLPYNVVLGSFVVSTFTDILTIGLPTHTHMLNYINRMLTLLPIDIPRRTKRPKLSWVRAFLCPYTQVLLVF